MPQNVSSLVVYYNADLFRSAGVELPRDGWAWDDMVAAAKNLTRDRDDDGTVDVYGLGVDPEIIRVAPFIWSNGGRLVDDEAVADAVLPRRSGRRGARHASSISGPSTASPPPTRRPRPRTSRVGS